MDRLFISFCFLFFVSFDAHSRVRPFHLIFKLLNESEAHSYSGATVNTEFKRDSIKVLVWNIKKASLLPWENEFRKYGQARDLILIQEAYQKPLFSTALEKFENVRWDMGASFLYRLYNYQATGSMIGSKVDPTYVRVVHSPDLEPVAATPKSTTVARYPVEGTDRELLVLSIHGINITSFATFTRQLDELKAEIQNHDGPVLFAGDFNTRTHERTQYLFNFMSSLNLRPVEFKNGHCRMKFKFTPYYLDHSFIRGLEVKDSEVDCQSKGSDHRPMSLELALI